MPVHSVRILSPVSQDFPAKGAVMTAKSAGYLPKAELGHSQMTDDMPLRGVMGVGHNGLLLALVVGASNITRYPIMFCFFSSPTA